MRWEMRAGLVMLASACLACAQTILTGRVVDDNGAPLDNAHVRASRDAALATESLTNPTGAFRLALPAEGAYQIVAEHPGYFRLDRSIQVAAAGSEVTLILNAQREVFQSVDVGDTPSPIDPAQTSKEERLSGTEINNIPYPATHSLRNALKMNPGVVQDSTGGIHVQGAAENQTRYLLNGFDITDPVTGRYSTILAMEGVRELSLVSARGSPELGRGSGGTLAIRSESGTDQFHVTATNFVPGLDTHHGIHFGHLTPRAGFSGPFKRGRAWFSDSFYGDYNPTFHNGLPSGQDTDTYWAAGNLLNAQVNITPSNILYTSLLTNLDRENRAGLGVLDPVETTTRRRGNEWLATVKNSHSWNNGSLLEAGISALSVYHRVTPQGSQPYLLSPVGRRGNYFSNSRESGERQQGLVNYYPPAFRAGGRHQLQIGGDVQHLSYDASFHRTSYELLGLSGSPLSETRFLGAGRFGNGNLLQSSYLNDQWRPAERITLTLGFRQDWDRTIGENVLSPRIAVAYAPFPAARTKITAGYSVFHDASNLATLSAPLDQSPVTIPYSPADGADLPRLSIYRLGRGLKLPYYRNWSAGIAHDFGHRLSAQVEWLRKRGRDGFVYAAAPDALTVPMPALPGGFAAETTYALTNLRRDAYDELGLTLRQSFGDQYEWFASYVRSRAVSNAVLDVRVDQIYSFNDNVGRMPWDAPNRFLSWGYLPLPVQAPGKWSLAYLVEWRSGFPFAVVRDTGEIVGPVDSHRFPANFDLNLHVERRFEFRGQRFAVRIGMNNLTGHRNSSAVYNVIGSPQYLQYAGDEGRHMVLRIRFFGKHS